MNDNEAPKKNPNYIIMKVAFKSGTDSPMFIKCLIGFDQYDGKPMWGDDIAIAALYNKIDMNILRRVKINFDNNTTMIGFIDAK